MNKFYYIIAIIIFLSVSVSAETKSLRLVRSDQFEIVKEGDKYITYVVGRVKFKTETGFIYCDSARWDKGEGVVLNGKVFIDEKDYRITADSVDYNLKNKELYAYGKKVEMWSYSDSLMAVGQKAYYNESDKFFTMDQRPTLFLKYPDSSAMFEIIADEIVYDAETKEAEANGNVNISSKEFSSYSGCAKMKTNGNFLNLFEKPSVTKDKSTISGEFISLFFRDDKIEYIDVLDSANGNFKIATDSTEEYFDESILRGERIKVYFQNGLMNHIICTDKAYSWYYPSSHGSGEKQENSVSGDTIKLFVIDEAIRKVHVLGGAIGRYITAKPQVVDSNVIEVVDTIDYSSQFIEYAIDDSLITLKKSAHVKSGLVSLDAHHIIFDTKEQMIEAFSAEVPSDTVVNPYLLSEEVQPNVIPVVLTDKQDKIFGDYLIYSIETEKGRIMQSKTNFDKGLYYGKKLYREQSDIVYVEDGRFTTCDALEPHYHFKSSNMKMIEDDKMIVKPVVFYIERIPIFALPYYVFPLKKGRHSGFLPFTFGKFERGERYIKDIGYYWAASDYWDWKGALDYYDTRRTITFNSQVNFKLRYVLNGYVNGNWTRETSYISSTATETKRNRWTLKAAYNHTVTPSFSVRASGDFVSDATYYQDLSQNYDDISNRNTKSQISFNKKFGKNVSLSGNMNHNVDLDRESRTDNLPTMSLSLPTLYPFGNGSKNAEGRLVQKWINKISFRYSPRLQNFSSRVTNKNFFSYQDTVQVIDTSGIPVDSIFTVTDTTSWRSRKRFTKISHNPSINLPTMKLGNYLNINPSFNYNETWFKLYQTDQTDSAGIDASTTYRTYSYSAGVSANTNLYGTIYPNIFGLTGLRHVITPSIGYRYSPEIDRHPEVRAFAFGGAGSRKSRSLSVNLKQLFQAKVIDGEKDRNYQLLTINSGFSYNFENDDRPYSDLNTSLHVSQIPFISDLSGSMRHTFYHPDNGELNFWSPYLLSFSIRTGITISGKKFFLDDDINSIPRGVDSVSQVSNPGSNQRSGGWSLNLDYNYTESGRGESYNKSSYISLSLRFKLTPTTSISYSQNYSIHRNQTVRSTVNIVKKLHCWSGSIFWVPVGTNRGFGFKLFVTEMPAIKIDSNHDGFTQSLRNF